jgi:hypothetical protein
VLVCFARAAWRFGIGGCVGGRSCAACWRVETAAICLHDCGCAVSCWCYVNEHLLRFAMFLCWNFKNKLILGP